jgi:hypothetical protein
VSYSTCKTKLVLNDDKYNFVNKTYDDINKKRLDRIKTVLNKWVACRSPVAVRAQGLLRSLSLSCRSGMK